MIIFPAIDIQKGRCVRLRQGVETASTVYYEDPVEAAVHWEKEGAQYLHVVDLDGAFSGSGANEEAIREICRKVSVPVETGGGIRTEKDIERKLEMGVSRVILGSRAAEDPGFAREAAKEWGDRIAVSIDAKGDVVTTRGWVEGSGQKVLPFAELLLSYGVTVIVYTDISRDGMLTGPNFDMLGKLQKLEGISLIASGGMSRAEELEKLKSMGVYGAICGKSIYEGTITMAQIRKIQG